MNIIAFIWKNYTKLNWVELWSVQLIVKIQLLTAFSSILLVINMLLKNLLEFFTSWDDNSLLYSKNRAVNTIGLIDWIYKVLCILYIKEVHYT